MFLDEYSTPDAVAEIVKVDPAIAKAQTRLEAVTANEEFRQNYELRRKALSDWTTGVNTAFERGVEKERLYIAKNALAEIVKVDPAIAKAQTRLEVVTANEEFRQNYELRRKALSDWTTGVNTAFERGVEKGIEKGIEKGVEKERLYIAKNALAKGLPVDVMQDLTGLKIEDIIALQNEK